MKFKSFNGRIEFIYFFLLLAFPLFWGCPSGTNPTVTQSDHMVSITQSVSNSIGILDPIEDGSSGRSCSECHYKEYQDWSSSYHRHAMNLATPSNVRGDFSQKKYLHIAFDELVALSNDEISLLIKQFIQNDSSGIAPFTGREDLTTFARLATALSDTTPSLKSKFEKALDKDQIEQLKKESEFLNRVGPIRPDCVCKNQIALIDLVRLLIADGKIKTSIGTVIGLNRKDNSFFMTIEDQTGTPKEFPIKYVLGIFPLQQYLIQMADGRIQCLPLAWNERDKKWFHLYAKERIPASDTLHWTRSLQNWNHTCADCHTTEFEKNFDSSANTFASRWKEMGVGCSACHSDCVDHEKKARIALDSVLEKRNISRDEEDPFKRSESLRKLISRSGLLRRPVRLTDEDISIQSVDSCAPCHSRRHNLAKTIRPTGRKYSNYHIPERIGSDVYYADGQLKEESFEYVSFCQSRMYAMGVRCVDCHESHSLELKKPGNNLCGQCHRLDYYDNAGHHHHQTTLLPMKRESPSLPVKNPVQQTYLKGPGMNCVDCHLPAMNFMVIDRRYDHNIHIPRPQLTIDLGTPNACNLCHFRSDKGEDAAWAQHWIDKWYDPQKSIQRGRLATGEHYAYAIYAGIKKNSNAFSLLEKIIKERDTAKVRDIVRASALDLIARSDSSEWSENQKKQVLSLIQEGLTDSNDWIRRSAVSCLESFDMGIRYRYLSPLLLDSSRAVRTEVIRLLAAVDQSMFDDTIKNNFNRILAEYRQELDANCDQGASWLNRGVLEQNLHHTELEKKSKACQQIVSEVGQDAPVASAVQTEYIRTLFETTQQTLDAYQKGISISPDFLPLRINLAMLYYERGETTKAESEFRQALKIDPQQGETWYSLGLLLAETKQMEKAVEAFKTAVQLLPQRDRILYNYALALDKIGRSQEAIPILEKAILLNPNQDVYRSTITYIRNKIEKERFL